MQDVCVSDNGNVDNFFLDVVELSDRVDAKFIYNFMMASLQKEGVNNEFLRTHLISIASDGTAVLTGKTSGIIVKLKNEFPNVQSVYSLAHTFELAVKDALEEVAGCNHFEFSFCKLRFTPSPVNQECQIASRSSS